MDAGLSSPPSAQLLSIDEVVSSIAWLATDARNGSVSSESIGRGCSICFGGMAGLLLGGLVGFD